MMLKEGDIVPDVKLVGLEGQPVSPADFRGQKLVVYFYPKDDTSGCTREAQDFTALAGKRYVSSFFRWVAYNHRVNNNIPLITLNAFDVRYLNGFVFNSFSD